MSKVKNYMVNDNSYQQCIDTDCSNHYLGGMRGEIGKTVKVLVQPFKMKIRNIFNEEITLTFIIGLDESTNLRHLILYNF